jgi:hypothetical protein
VTLALWTSAHRSQTFLKNFFGGEKHRFFARLVGTTRAKYHGRLMPTGRSIG